MTAARRDDKPGESDALRTALDLLARGLWPVAIHAPTDRVGSPGKQPIGDEWGKARPSPAILRAIYAANPGAGVGIKLDGVVDIENDTGAEGEATLLEMTAGEELVTMGWASDRGPHRLVRFDPRFAKYGKSIIKIGGLEIRVGTVDLASPKQLQSVCPPSPRADGSPREWNGVEEIAALPEAFFAYLDRAFAAEPAAPRQTIPIYTPRPGEWTAEDRARAYLAKVDPAVAGQNGHNKAIYAACKIGPGFDLPPPVARALLAEWSRACQPPWSDRELDHKVAEAYKIEAARGWLLGENENASGRNKIPNNIKTPGERARDGNFDVIANFVTPAEEWERPRLFDREPVPTFPLDVFPSSLRDLCGSGAEAAGCPADFFGAYGIGVIGAGVGGSMTVQIKKGWTESACTYSGIVGLPGTRKSHPLRVMAGPLREADRGYRAKYQADRQAWDDDTKEARAAKEPCDPPPTLRQITLDDATKEAIALIHSHNPRGVAVVKDELSGLMASMNAYRAGRGDDEQFYMAAYSGSTIQVDRKGKPNEPIVVPRPFLTITGALVPDSLVAMRSKSDNGWMDRFQFCYPDDVPPQGWSDREIDEQCVDDWAFAMARLLGREMVKEDDGHARPFVVHLLPDAREQFVDWVNAHAREQNGPDFPASLRGPWSKLEAACGRFALCLAAIHQAYDPQADMARRPDVSALDVWGARKLVDYYKAHFRRVRAEMYGHAGLASDSARMILRWLIARAKEGGRDEHDRDKARWFTGRDLSQRFHRIPPEDREQALRWLAARHVIRDRDTSRAAGPGRPASALHEVNPHLLSGVTKFAETSKPPGDE